MTYYFIDYENVHAAGINSNAGLKAGDTVIIFYSANCANITLDILENLFNKDVSVCAYGVSGGSKNALDFQLCTYLGYCIAGHMDSKYVIISKDTGFDRVVEFWKKRKVEVSRQAQIGNSDDSSSAEKKVKKTKAKTTSTKEEMLKYLPPEQYSDQLLQIFNSYKTKTAINNGFSKYYRDSGKASEVLKKLKPLLKEKGKT